MKESLWAYWLVVLGIGIVSVMVVLQNYSTTDEQDYYMVKSVLEASMYDAIDYGYYRDRGELKMNREKFVENFIRRYAETVSSNRTYTFDFYQIYEIPPAASVKVTTKLNKYGFGGEANTEETVVPTRLTGILYTGTKYSPSS